MKALVKTAKGRGMMEICQVAVPKPDEDEVLLKIKVIGVCGSDIHIYQDNMRYNPPVIVGHEYVGEIVEMGKRVTGWQLGDRVTAEPHIGACGTCYYCRSGVQEFCRSKRNPGWIGDGCMAEYMKVPYKLLHRIPDRVTDKQAAIIEPTAVAANALLERAPIRAEEMVVVLGPGPIGLISAQIAKAYGASKVIIAGLDSDEAVRMSVARQLGIDYVVNLQKEDLKELVLSLSGGIGADRVVEASGANMAVNLAIDIVRSNGLVSVIGLPSKEQLAINWSQAVFKGIRCDFSFSHNYITWERVISMLASGRIQLDPLISHYAPLAQWEEVFLQLMEGKGIKALLVP